MILEGKYRVLLNIDQKFGSIWFISIQYLPVYNTLSLGVLIIAFIFVLQEDGSMFETPHSKPEKTIFGWELESKLERPPAAWSSFEMLAAATTKGMVNLFMLLKFIDLLPQYIWKFKFNQIAKLHKIENLTNTKTTKET